MSLRDGELSERKKLILKAIIDAHIENGEPVGSRYIMQNAQIAYSSATIRNEMAELEEMGYLEQPHTSAGRVPSELGYRFYVDTMLSHYAMTQREIAELNNLLRSKQAALDTILEQASKLASALTNYTGISVKPKPAAASIRRFETVWVDSRSFILVMVTSTGVAKSKFIHLGFDVMPETTGRLAAALNANLAGLSAEQITLPAIMRMETAMGLDSVLVSPIIKCIYETMSELDGGDVRFEGINRLLQYPEYADVGRFKQLLGALEEKQDILDLVSGSSADDVNIYIGSENTVDVMQNSSLVFKTVRCGGHTVGAIGILGPCRMDYSRVVAMIEHLAGQVSAMLDEDGTPPNLLNGG
ncbi:MAG: heat-inducible transcription repressor HrcA [Clostridia bacterium]|nr:heat-inducible transcription repressor HrcA [Clostridia bacterium]